VGIYDREYYRQERSGPSFSTASWSVVGVMIAINVALWVLDFFTPGNYAVVGGRALLVGRWLSDHLAVHVDTLTQPWLWWQYLTAGFAHSPLKFEHILFNMLVLFFLGRDVEQIYGSREFLRLYLTLVVFTALVWNAVNLIGGTPGPVGAYGASGAIAGVVILYALNFPHRTLLLFFVIPIPAWLLGILVVAIDIYGAIGQRDNIAYSMHLAGAAFAFIYYKQGWNFTRLSEGRFAWLRFFHAKPRLRVHQPEQEAESDLNQEVDRILEKIYREGEASLTSKERKFLETASREFQQRGGSGPSDK